MATLSSVHISFPPNRWPALLPLTMLTLNCMRPFSLDPSRSAWHGIHGQKIDFAAHPIHPAGQLVVSHDPPNQRPSWARHGTRGFYLAPALTHYRSHLIFIPSTLDTRISNQIDLFPDPLFVFEDPTILVPPPDPTSSRPCPTYDGTDLVGQSFLDPDLGLCTVTGPGQPSFLQPFTGNLEPHDPRILPGWHPTLSYTTPTGAVESSTVLEVARWLTELPARPPPTLLAQSTPPRPPPQPEPAPAIPTLRPAHPTLPPPLPAPPPAVTLRRSPRFSPGIPPPPLPRTAGALSLRRFVPSVRRSGVCPPPPFSSPGFSSFLSTWIGSPISAKSSVLVSPSVSTSIRFPNASPPFPQFPPFRFSDSDSVSPLIGSSNFASQSSPPFLQFPPFRLFDSVSPLIGPLNFASQSSPDCSPYACAALLAPHAVFSAGAPLALFSAGAHAPPEYWRAPLPPPPAHTTPTWFPTEDPVACPAVATSGSAPVLNLDQLGKPLTFRSALAGPFGDQWRRANGDELLKLVETTRSLTPSITPLPFLRI